SDATTGGGNACSAQAASISRPMTARTRCIGWGTVIMAKVLSRQLLRPRFYCRLSRGLSAGREIRPALPLLSTTGRENAGAAGRVPLVNAALTMSSEPADSGLFQRVHGAGLAAQIGRSHEADGQLEADIAGYTDALQQTPLRVLRQPARRQQPRSQAARDQGHFQIEIVHI